VKPAIFVNLNHARIFSLNQPVLSNESKNKSCSRIQQESLIMSDSTSNFTLCAKWFIVI